MMSIWGNAPIIYISFLRKQYMGIVSVALSVGFTSKYQLSIALSIRNTKPRVLVFFIKAVIFTLRHVLSFT